MDPYLGKTKYYAIRIEFQVRRSPHIHCFIWILNTPVLNDNSLAEYVSFVDKTVHAYLPNKNENPNLHELVKLY